jgi:hypothetical protein
LPPLSERALGLREVASRNSINGQLLVIHRRRSVTQHLLQVLSLKEGILGKQTGAVCFSGGLSCIFSNDPPLGESSDPRVCEPLVALREIIPFPGGHGLQRRLGPPPGKFVVLPQKVEPQIVLHSEQMSNTITVRLPEDLAGWLEEASKKAGVPRGRIIREQLELARRRHDQPFLHLAGSVDGARDLSARKGFAKK